MTLNEYLDHTRTHKRALLDCAAKTLGPAYDLDTCDYAVSGVIQDTWSRIFQHDLQVHNLQAYLYRAVVTRSIDILRTAVPEISLSDFQIETDEGINEAYEIAEMGVYQPDPILPWDVHAALSCLTERQQRLIYLICIDGLSQRETAREMGIKWQAQVRRELKPALAILRKKLQDYKEKP